MTRDFVKIFREEEKIIEYQKQKNCQGFPASLRKKIEIIQRNEKKP